MMREEEDGLGPVLNIGSSLVFWGHTLQKLFWRELLLCL